MKKLITLLTLLLLTQACTVTPHNGVRATLPILQTETVSLSRHGLHIPNIIYPLEVGGTSLLVYIDTGSMTLEEFLCTLYINC